MDEAKTFHKFGRFPEISISAFLASVTKKCSLSRGVMRLGEKEKNEKPVNINVESECLTVNVKTMILFVFSSVYLFNSNKPESFYRNSPPRFHYWEVEYKTNWPRLDYPPPHHQH